MKISTPVHIQRLRLHLDKGNFFVVVAACCCFPPPAKYKSLISLSLHARSVAIERIGSCNTALMVASAKACKKREEIENACTVVLLHPEVEHFCEHSCEQEIAPKAWQDRYGKFLFIHSPHFTLTSCPWHVLHALKHAHFFVVNLGRMGRDRRANSIKVNVSVDAKLFIRRLTHSYSYDFQSCHLTTFHFKNERHLVQQNPLRPSTGSLCLKEKCRLTSGSRRLRLEMVSEDVT